MTLLSSSEDKMDKTKSYIKSCGEEKSALIEKMQWLSPLYSEAPVGEYFLHQELTLDEIKLLSEAIGQNHTITSLNLNYRMRFNKKSSTTGISIENGRDIGIDGSKALSIGNEGTTILAEALKKNHYIQDLLLSNNLIGIEAALALADALKSNNNLLSLSLNQNPNIKAKGTIALMKALKDNQSIKYINLAHTKMGSEGAVAVSNLIKINSSLTYINLSHNLIRDEGAEALAEAFMINKTLNFVDLTVNNITTRGAELLTRGLKYNKSLTGINIRFNPTHYQALRDKRFWGQNSKVKNIL